MSAADVASRPAAGRRTRPSSRARAAARRGLRDLPRAARTSRSTASGSSRRCDEALALPARRPAARLLRRLRLHHQHRLRPGAAGLRRSPTRRPRASRRRFHAVLATTSPAAGSSATACEGKHVLEIGCGKGEFLVDDDRARRRPRPSASTRSYDGRARPARRPTGSTFIEDLLLRGATRTWRPTPSSAGTRSSTSAPTGDFWSTRAPLARGPPGARRCCSSCPTCCACCARSRSGTSTTSTAPTSRPARWRGCSGAPGFDVLDLALDYDDQYILIEGRPPRARRPASRAARGGRRGGRRGGPRASAASFADTARALDARGSTPRAPTASAS